MKNAESQLKIGILLNYINLILGGLIPFFYTPIMLRLLGQEEYGLYKLSGSITSYLSLLSLGLGAAITRYLIKARTEFGEEEEQKILGLFVLIFRCISLITLIIGVILAMCIDNWYQSSLSAEFLYKMRWLVFILACNTAISFIATPYISVVNSHERFIFLQGMAIFSTCVGPILNLLALFMGYASIGLAISSMIATVFFRIIYYIYVRKEMEIRPVFCKVPSPLIKDILVFSFWVFVSQIVGQLYEATDTVLIGAVPVLATVGVAVYNIGMVFHSMIFTINAGVSSLLIPKANKMVFSGVSNQELNETSIKVGRIQCLIISLFVFGFISFGKPFIHFYVGDGYMRSYWIALLCMIPGMIPLLQSFYLNILIAKNKNKFRALTYLFIASINVVGTWILINRIGIIGASLMTGLSILIGHGFIMNWYFCKRMGLQIRQFWFEMCKIWFSPFVLCAISIFSYKFFDFYNVYNLLIGIFSFSLIYFIVQWKWSLNAYERGLIRQLTNRIFA